MVTQMSRQGLYIYSTGYPSQTKSRRDDIEKVMANTFTQIYLQMIKSAMKYVVPTGLEMFGLGTCYKYIVPNGTGCSELLILDICPLDCEVTFVN